MDYKVTNGSVNGMNDNVGRYGSYLYNDHCTCRKRQGRRGARLISRGPSRRTVQDRAVVSESPQRLRYLGTTQRHGQEKAMEKADQNWSWNQRLY